MAQKTRTQLKAYFETGDKPTEAQFVDLIESVVNLPDGATMAGALVSADHGTATNPEVVSVVYGTGSAPTADTTPIGTLFVKYTA